MLIICFEDNANGDQILRWKAFSGTLEEFETTYPQYVVIYVFTKEDNLLR